MGGRLSKKKADVIIQNEHSKKLDSLKESHFSELVVTDGSSFVAKHVVDGTPSHIKGDSLTNWIIQHLNSQYGKTVEDEQELQNILFTYYLIKCHFDNKDVDSIVVDGFKRNM